MVVEIVKDEHGNISGWKTPFVGTVNATSEDFAEYLMVKYNLPIFVADGLSFLALCGKTPAEIDKEAQLTFVKTLEGSTVMEGPLKEIKK